jgi:predicted secreted protein
MDRITRKNLENLLSKDGELRYEALIHVLKVTDKRVDWAYDVWDQLVESLRHQDNHRRAIAAQVLCNLAKSDPENRMLKDFNALFAVTKDERFVTARHSLQAIWKVGAAGKKQQKMVVDRLAGRFTECVVEKNCTLIRYDIIQGLRKLYDEAKDEKVRAKALELIESEQDLKYRKKYAGLWKDR